MLSRQELGVLVESTCQPIQLEPARWGTPPRSLQACTLGNKGDLWLQARPELGWWRVAEQPADMDLCPQFQPELASLDGGAPQGKWQTWTFGHKGDLWL